ncbi:MAG: undecaprenyl/decaprenyl-phosphate alpha-N-acetylglucosaminyl 1-phosphate transferase [Chloroflexi bacterium]|nr:undecaprenyl/decaprenyl-phosphate alpha-N-acetylglucosaminyl 1-phosphate transferase [Chloroflexota bacterium]
MTNFIVIFITAFVFAVAATPVARWTARRLRLVDTPSARRVHMLPTPLLGGVAIYGAFILALLFFYQSFQLPQLISILVGATLVSFLGIWDDSRGLRPLLKLVGQGAAAMVLIAAGVHVSFLGNVYLNYAVTLVWVVGITNALNLLDNMDGLSGGMAAVASAFFVLLAFLSGQYLVGALGAALLGACLGFLLYNMNPASIFMGDTGSLFLGFVLAALGIKLRFENIPAVTWMVPVLVLGLPIFDTALVVISRLRRRCNPLTTPGKDHTSHRLVASGMSHRRAVLTLYGVCVLLGLMAVAVTRATVIEAYIMGGTVAVVGLWALVQLELKGYDSWEMKTSGLVKERQ